MLSSRPLAASLAAAVLAAGSADAMFRFDCFNNLVIDRADPITHFGKPAAHLHAVSGGNGFSTTADGAAMANSTCTSCPISADKSAYWVPQMYVKFKNGTGYGLVESHQIVYYQPRGSKGEEVIAFPPGLKMLAGDPKLRSGSDDIKQRAITWVCLDYKNNNPVKEQQGIPNAKCPDGLRGQVNFPMCWNGKDLDSPDHQSHVAYAEGLDGGACPAGYKKMVKIFYETFFQVGKWDSEWVDGKHPFVLANGDPTGFGFHGDFLNGWDVPVLQAAIDQCEDKNYFNAGECAPLKASFSDKPPAQRCTTKPQVDEPINNVAKLPGNNPVTTVATPASTPEAGNEDGEEEDTSATTTPKPSTPATKAPSTTAVPSATPETPIATVATVKPDTPPATTASPSQTPTTTAPKPSASPETGNDEDGDEDGTPASTTTPTASTPASTKRCSVKPE